MPKYKEKMPILEYCQKNDLRILASWAFQFFYEHLEHTKGNYLEIGTFEGFMLRELAKLYPRKMFYGIDPFIEDGNTLGHQVNRVGVGEFMFDQCAITHANIDDVPNIKLFQETSRAWGERHTDAELSELGITSVFVDGNHSYEEAYNDLQISLRVLSRGGLILVDDSGIPSVQQALIEFGTVFEDRLAYKKGHHKGTGLIYVKRAK